MHLVERSLAPESMQSELLEDSVASGTCLVYQSDPKSLCHRIKITASRLD